MTPEEKEAIWQEYIRILPKVIEAQGLANTVAGISLEVDVMVRRAEDGSSKRGNLITASEAIDRCLSSCDLAYK